MIALALVLAAAASFPVVDEVVRVPPGGVQAVNLSLQQQAAVIEVSFAVVGGPSEISVALLGPGDAASGRRGAPGQYLRLLSRRREGEFRFPASMPGDYQVILDNRGRHRGAAAVKLRVALSFGEAAGLRPRTLSPERRLMVILASLLFFAAVSLYSGRKLLRAMRKRRRGGQLPLF